MATSWQQDGIGLAHLHGMDHNLGSICPNNDDDLKESSRPIGPQVQRLVGVATVVSRIESVRHGVAYVVIVEPVTGLVLPC
jgi:hypothetical protein